jgi:hypothetical protein
MSVGQANSLSGDRPADPGLLSAPAKLRRPGHCDAARFWHEKGRPPILGEDPVAPWHYRGWLRTHILAECSQAPYEYWEQHCPAIARWFYHLETHMAGRLLDKPIPQLSFSHPARIEREVTKGKKKERSVSSVKREWSQIEDWSRIIGRDMGGWSDFSVLLDWLQWGFGLVKTEPQIEEAKAERLFPSLISPRRWPPRPVP